MFVSNSEKMSPEKAIKNIEMKSFMADFKLAFKRIEKQIFLTHVI